MTLYRRRDPGIIGAVVTVTALSGEILSVAGAALCFVPYALGRSLLYSERITP